MFNFALVIILVNKFIDWYSIEVIVMTTFGSNFLTI